METILFNNCNKEQIDKMRNWQDPNINKIAEKMLELHNYETKIRNILVTI